MDTSMDTSFAANNTTQHIKEQEHERPLLMRVMFGGDVKSNVDMSIHENPVAPLQIQQTPDIQPVEQAIIKDPIAPIEHVQKMIGGNSHKSKGGADPNDILAQATYFRKINTLFVILLFSIMFAVAVTNMFVGMIFNMNDEDANFEQEEFDYKQRWKRIIKLTVVFIIMIIIFHFIVILIILLFFAVKIGITNEDPNLHVFPTVWAKVKEIVWVYKDDLNNEVGLIGYYMLLFLVLVVMFLFFMIYTLLAKGYFTNIMYETVYNEKNPDVQDRTQQNKYLFQYAVYVLVMMLFVLLLLNYDKLRDKKLIFIYNIIFVMIYVILTLNILRFQLQRKFVNLLLYIFLFLFLFFMYGRILKTLAKFMPK